MNLDDLLKDVVIEKAVDPDNSKSEVYRAVYQLAGKNPVVLTGWFKTIEKAVEAAKENLLLGILDGKQVKINNEEGLGAWAKSLKSGISLGALSLLGNFKSGGSSVLNFAADKVDDIKSLLKKLFLFKNGKALLNGSENEIGSSLLKLFGNFDDVENEAVKTHNSVLLENASKVLKRVNPDEVALEDLDVLVNNKENKGLRFLDKLVDNSKEDLKEENKSLKDYFLSYFDGLKGVKDASPLYANTKPLRDKLAALLGGFKSGSLPGLGSLAGLGLTGYGLGKALDGVKKDVDLPKEVDKANVSKVAPVSAAPSKSYKEDEDKKKGGLLPKLLLGAGALGLLSTPFWAIPYNVNLKTPDGANVVGDVKKSVKFFEDVKLPELSMPNMNFEGWYSDPNFNNKVESTGHMLGSKSFFPKFSEDTTQLNNDAKNKLSGVKGLFDGLKDLIKLPNLDANLKSEYDDIEKKIGDFDAKLNAGNLSAKDLDSLIADIDGLTPSINTLKSNLEKAQADAGSDASADASGAGSNASGNNASGSNASGNNASGSGSSGNDGSQSGVPNTGAR